MSGPGYCETSRKHRAERGNGWAALIRNVEPSELKEVWQVHRAAFPNSALTALGAEAVCRYYAWLIDGPHDAEFKGVWGSGELDGFIVAGRFRGALTGFVRNNRLFLTARVAARPWSLFNVEFRKRVHIALHTIRRPWRRRQTSHSLSPIVDLAQRQYGVLSIAVHPRAWGTGVADALMESADQGALDRNIGLISLTVHPDNLRAIRFYERLGWLRLARDGVWEGKMIKHLDLSGQQ